MASAAVLNLFGHGGRVSEIFGRWSAPPDVYVRGNAMETMTKPDRVTAAPSKPEPVAAPERDEAFRMAALRSYDILDTEHEPAFDRVVDLARVLFQTPTALVTFVDAERQWFKARLGLDVAETHRAHAFCDHVIRQDGVMVVPDAREDPRFAANPLVTGGPRIRFYAGAPIVTPEGARLGTVCIISPEPRAGLDEHGASRLTALAEIAVSELELRRQATQARNVAMERGLLLQEMEHRVGSSLRLVNFVLEAQAKRNLDAEVQRALYDAADRIAGVEALHQHLRRGDPTLTDDARSYLATLIGSLQDSILDETSGRRVVLSQIETLILPADLLARLGMVVTELVLNALRHGSGNVDIRLVRDGQTVVASVTDEGSGVSADRRPLLAAERPGLQIVSMLAVPNGVTIDPACPRRVMVRLAAAALRP